LETIILTGPNQ